jgi:hypothetical protein
MIIFRSLLQTVELMEKEVYFAALAALASVFGAEAAPGLFAFARALGAVVRILKPIDRALSDRSRGVGWLSMKAMDTLNIGIKTDFPIWAELETRDFAKRNGADRGLHGILIPRESSAYDLLPALPIARGRKEELIDRAQQSYLKYVQPFPAALAGAIAAVLPANPVAIFMGMVAYNTSNLRGSRITTIISPVLSLFVTGPLKWPNDPPRPMLLTDQPAFNPNATMEVKESAANLSKVRKHLQYLAIATGKMSSGSRIGGEHFLNVAPYQSLAYAEADVYNPTKWSLFEQNWRVKLAPSVVLNEKINQLAGIFGIRSIPPSFNGLAFANNH